MARPPRVYVDIREEKSGIPSLLEAMGLIVIKRQLPMGDYLLADDVVVERKSSYDLVKSIFDGRLFEQASRLAENYSHVYFVVEGRIVPARYRGKAKNVYAALAALAADYDVKILYSDGEETTAHILYTLAKKLSSPGGQRIVIHKKPKLSDLREWQLYVVQSFPGIGRKTAERILERLGSVEAFCRASVAELSRIEGVGEKKADTIKRILVTPYTPTGRKRRVNLEDFYSDA